MRKASAGAAFLAAFLLAACGESSFSGGSGGKKPVINKDADALPERTGENDRDPWEGGWGGGGSTSDGKDHNWPDINPGDGKEHIPPNQGPDNPDTTGNTENPDGGGGKPQCNGNSQDRTQVRLLTNSVQNNAANQIVRYELWLVDCNGNPKPIPKAPLLFDINAQATFDVMSRKMPFTIQDSNGNGITSGQMNIIQGSDLFGQQGSNFYHWRIDEFSFNNNDRKLYLNLDVSYLGWLPVNPQEQGNSTYRFSTYLRIGDALPVEQVVTWTN